jgi:hypothetical protein
MKNRFAWTVLVFSLCGHQHALAADPLPRVDPGKARFSAAALESIDRLFADEIARDRVLVYGATQK